MLKGGGIVQTMKFLCDNKLIDNGEIYSIKSFCLY
jgi:hypothetical protein